MHLKSSINPFVLTNINIYDINMNPLYFDRVNGPKHENHIKFHFGGNPFGLGGFEIWKFGYWKKIPDLQI